jgi:tRNA-uridine 2-sulfurtransferase
MTKQKTVFVGLSGGVDSSVAALRLQKAGYNVVGVFIKVWHPDWLVCNWEQERLDAMRVAAHLEIPFLTCNAEDAYRDAVAHYFIESYRAGRTPNPDVMCNKEVKFGAFLQFAQEHGADYVATGHYARKGEGESGATALLCGIDTSKDQSYFLWSLSVDQLRQTLFPIGDTQKNGIREEALAAGLPTATKKDSQGVCFLGHIDIPEFLSHYIDLIPGVVLDEAGTVLGEHQGAFVYTLGQRHGFTIHHTSPEEAPWYVVSKDVAHNTITVSHTPPELIAGSSLTLTDLIWRGDTLPHAGETLQAQFRYRQTAQPVTIQSADADTIVIEVNGQTDKPASGQSCVLYQGDTCLGGGIIA